VLLVRNTIFLLYPGRVVDARMAVRVTGRSSVRRATVGGSTNLLYAESYQVSVAVMVYVPGLSMPEPHSWNELVPLTGSAS
jgi:hypothetical protein